MKYNLLLRCSPLEQNFNLHCCLLIEVKQRTDNNTSQILLDLEKIQDDEF